MNQVVRSRTLPACSRCSQDQLVTVAKMPKTDSYGWPIRLELCKVCDADKPAASAVIRFFSTGGGHDTRQAEEGARLMMEWTKEGMGAYGWFWEEAPADSGGR